MVTHKNGQKTKNLAFEAVKALLKQNLPKELHSLFCEFSNTDSIDMQKAKVSAFLTGASWLSNHNRISRNNGEAENLSIIHLHTVHSSDGKTVSHKNFIAPIAKLAKRFVKLQSVFRGNCTDKEELIKQVANLDRIGVISYFDNLPTSAMLAQSCVLSPKGAILSLTEFDSAQKKGKSEYYSELTEIMVNSFVGESTNNQTKGEKSIDLTGETSNLSCFLATQPNREGGVLSDWLQVDKFIQGLVSRLSIIATDVIEPTKGIKDLADDFFAVHYWEKDDYNEAKGALNEFYTHLLTQPPTTYQYRTDAVKASKIGENIQNIIKDLSTDMEKLISRLKVDHKKSIGATLWKYFANSKVPKYIGIAQALLDASDRLSEFGHLEARGGTLVDLSRDLSDNEYSALIDDILLLKQAKKENSEAGNIGLMSKDLLKYCLHFDHKAKDNSDRKEFLFSHEAGENKRVVSDTAVILGITVASWLMYETLDTIEKQRDLFDTDNDSYEELVFVMIQAQIKTGVKNGYANSFDELKQFILSFSGASNFSEHFKKILKSNFEKEAKEVLSDKQALTRIRNKHAGTIKKMIEKAISMKDVA